MKSEFIINNISYRLAIWKDFQKILSFHELYLTSNNTAIYSDEFLCTSGIYSAVINNRMVLVLKDNEIIGLARFYLQKKVQCISLYQFAIAEGYRGNGLSEGMFSYLQKIYNCPLESCCPIDNTLNHYYEKNNWKLKSTYKGLNHWVKNID